MNHRMRRIYSILISAAIFMVIIIPIIPTLDTVASSEIDYWDGFRTNELKKEIGQLSNDSNNIFWFAHMTDVHINAFQLIFGNQTEVFKNALEQINEYIKPLFIVDSGDMVNGLNPLPYYQVLEQWKARWRVLEDTEMNDSYYYDIPGNHDGYGDSDTFSYYLNWSIQKKLNYTFNAPVSFGNYTFIGLNSVWNDGSEWPDGTEGELDTEELDWFEKQLKNHNSNLTFIFSHHPYNDVGDSRTTSGLSFLQILEKYNVSVHFFGHGHENMERNKGGTAFIETPSLGMGDEEYRIFAVDNDGISEKVVSLNTYPVAMITSPMDRDFSRVAYDIPNTSTSVPVRALVFDQVAVDSVQFNIDGDPWVSMMNNLATKSLWNGSFDATLLSEGIHTINLRAKSQSGESTDSISIFVGTSVKPEIINGEIKNIIRYSDSNPLRYNLTMYKWDKKDTNDQLYWNISGLDPNFCSLSIIGDKNNTLLVDPVNGASGTKRITIELYDSEGYSTTQQITITLNTRLGTNQLLLIIGILELIFLVVIIIAGLIYYKKYDRDSINIKK
ncbi:MAG: hypothetical protein GF329_12705 [Candidatus Lokiarchaeota archaeon]|nr:hypothetical protein [Candidatus Lokiarchaeota archaeon]